MRHLALLLVFALACREAPATVEPPMACAADSLQAEVDSLRVELSDLRVLVSLSEQQMKRYAAIVARDPSQVVFLRGWTARAFAGVLPDTLP